MKANRKKLELAMARACVNAHEIAAQAEMPQPTVMNVLAGRSVKPRTLGRVAKVLGVDVTEIIEEAAS